MAKLNSNTLLQRIPELTLRLNSNGTVLVKWANNELLSSAHTLMIVDTFSEPLTLKQAIEKLQVTSGQDWVTLNNTVQQLFKAGILQDADSPSPPNIGLGFGHPGIHLRMLNDSVRTNKYIKAIQDVVKAGDLVIDLGTGTGVLAMAAANAGAKHVFAIEADKAIAKVAQTNFERNDLSDRITLCHGWSTQIKLPQKADVLISEIMGNDPFDEQVLIYVADARKRLLKPNARMLPERLTAWGLPVTIPTSDLEMLRPTETMLDDWQSQYKLDLSALKEMQYPASRPLFSRLPQKITKWTRLADPLCLASIDLSSFEDTGINTVCSGSAHSAGTLNGLACYFEAILSPDVTLSTHPDKADKNNHWSNVIWGVNPAITVNPGDAFSVQYQFRGNKMVRVWPGEAR